MLSKLRGGNDVFRVARDVVLGQKRGERDLDDCQRCFILEFCFTGFSQNWGL